MTNIVVSQQDKFIKYASDDNNFVLFNGYLAGNQIVVPVNSNIPKDSFILIPKDLLPSYSYFTANSDYADGGIWDIVQKRGELKDYSYAFSNWEVDSVIIPKYPLRDIANCMYALKDCSLTDGRTLVFHITNENPSMMYVCSNCGKMVYAPKFVFYNAPIVRNYMSMYAGCLKMKEASVYWGDGSTDPIAERTSCQNMFFKCDMLEEVQFTGKGSPLHLDLSYSNVLKYSTLLSLADSLMNIDVTEAASKNSVHEIVISSDTWVMLTGKGATGVDDYDIMGIEDFSESTEQPSMYSSTEIIPYMDSMEYMTNITFELEIMPRLEQSTNQNFYVKLYRNFEEGAFYSTTPNSLVQVVSFSMMTKNGTVWEKFFDKGDLSTGIRLSLINFTCPCDIKIRNLRYTYCDNTKLFTSKGWNITY